MAITPSDRAYGWALQTNFQTKKDVANAAFKQIMATDSNFLDFAPNVANNEDWANGVGSPTDEWIETRDSSVSHTIPGIAQEIGKVLYLTSQYAITTPSGASIAKQHNFKPTDPAVTRQDKAVTYAEKLGAGWNVLMPRSVCSGWTLKGDGTGLLTLDFSLLGAGLVITNSGATWFPTATPSVTPLTGLHKLFNTQVGLVISDNGTPTNYGCRYRSFEISFKKTMLSDAGYKPGCADFFTPGKPESGIVRSAHEFDKQTLDFTFAVEMATSSPEFNALLEQKPLDIVLTVTGGEIETGINHKLTLLIPVAKYNSVKPAIGNGIATFNITGRALFDFVTSKLFEAQLITDVANYATAF